ncbi:MAG TPA: SprT family zinc-dependent metalloprotease [Gallionellaceae bacterium]
MFKAVQRLIEPPAVERRSVRLSDQEISYTLKRSGKRRSIGLRIDEDGLTVAMPLRASEKWLHSVLQEKADWVVEKLAEWEAKKPEPMRWLDGEVVRFMGEALTLRVVASLFEAPPMLQGRQLFVHVADSANHAAIEQAVSRWLQQEAARLFRERVAHYVPMLGVSPSEVKLSSARTQWGSCTARGTVHLNWRLVRLPLRLIDYVVVHEISHLVEMNHSAAFWEVVKSACPDFRKRRNELRRVGLAE